MQEPYKPGDGSDTRHLPPGGAARAVPGGPAGRLSSAHLHRDAGVAGHVGHLDPARSDLVDGEVGPATDHLLQGHPALHPGQRRAQAGVDPEAEPQGVAGVPG